MKMRTAKKIARAWLDGRRVNGKYFHAPEEWKESNDSTAIMIYPRSGLLRRAVWNEAVRRGWDGNHWDNPFIVARFDENGKEVPLF